MTHTSEFLSQMAKLDDGVRAYAMTNYLAHHGDSSMTESLRLVVDHAERLVTDPASSVWEGVPAAIAEAFTSGNREHLDVVIGVWNSWVDVVNAARANGGVVVAASNTSAASTSAPSSAPAGGSGSGAATAAGPSRCPSCGVPSVGVCNRCENQSILDDHVEYDRRLYEIDQDRIEHDRLRDDRTAYDTSPSYDSGYDAGSSSSYDDN